MSSRVFAVTGTARGMGLEWVKQLSSDPRNVVFAIARKVSPELVALTGPNTHIIVGDISDAASINAAVHEIEQRTDKIDVLINNAGVLLEGGGPIAFIDIPIAMFEESFRVNVLGTIQTTLAFLPLLRRGAEKKVVNINSLAGSIGMIDPEHEFFWKQIALNMATRKFDANLRHEGFTFIALHPGWVNTDMGEVKDAEGAVVKSSYTTEESIRDSWAIIDKVTPETAGKLYAVDTEDKTLPW
ncbi:NAD(P)-binding protein [Atractiella rhizophila]|nr:NAD(P)-binding protein [Atractiella rhizophila]